MDRKWATTAGTASILGAILALITNVPTTWYGLAPRDSYVFHPPALSPLWISRNLVPVLAVVAVLGLLLGIAGLIRRDWPVAGRARRVGGIGAVIGLGCALVAVPLLLWGFRDPRVLFATFGGLAFAGLGLVVLVPSLLVLAYGYARTDRPVLGYALGGLVVAVPLLGYLVRGPLQAMAAAVPIALVWGLVGVHLVRSPTPLTASERET